MNPSVTSKYMSYVPCLFSRKVQQKLLKVLKRLRNNVVLWHALSDRNQSSVLWARSRFIAWNEIIANATEIWILSKNTGPSPQCGTWTGLLEDEIEHTPAIETSALKLQERITRRMTILTRPAGRVYTESELQSSYICKGSFPISQGKEEFVTFNNLRKTAGYQAMGAVKGLPGLVTCLRCAGSRRWAGGRWRTARRRERWGRFGVQSGDRHYSAAAPGLQSNRPSDWWPRTHQKTETVIPPQAPS